MEEIDNRKVATGAERQLKYKENNEAKVKLNQLKQNIARATLKETNPSKAEAVREANKRRKAGQRRKKKELKENKKNETSSPNINNSKNDETPSRQNIIDRKLRKKDTKKKQINLDEVLAEHSELKRVQNRHDDLVIELDFQSRSINYRRRSRNKK